MAIQKKIAVFCILVVLAVSSILMAEGRIFACIKNCHQCKAMYGKYFLGEVCADSCLKYKGKLMPDCQDKSTFEDFLAKIENE